MADVQSLLILLCFVEAIDKCHWSVQAKFPVVKGVDRPEFVERTIRTAEGVLKIFRRIGLQMSGCFMLHTAKEGKKTYLYATQGAENLCNIATTRRRNNELVNVFMIEWL